MDKRKKKKNVASFVQLLNLFYKFAYSRIWVKQCTLFIKKTEMHVIHEIWLFTAQINKLTT